MLSRWNWVMTRQNAIQLCPDTSSSNKHAEQRILTTSQNPNQQLTWQHDMSVCLGDDETAARRDEGKINPNAGQHDQSATQTDTTKLFTHTRHKSVAKVRHWRLWHGMASSSSSSSSWVSSAMTYHRRCVIWTWQAAADLSLYLATSYLHQPTRYTFFYHTTHAHHAIYAMLQCPSVCPSHAGIHHWITMAECIIVRILSPTVVEVQAYVTQWSTHRIWNPTLAPEWWPPIGQRIACQSRCKQLENKMWREHCSWQTD